MKATWMKSSCALAAALALQTEALALETDAVAQPSPEVASPEVNGSSDTDARGAGLDEITVTARRRTESGQVVPTALTVVSADALRESNITDIVSLQRIVPGMATIGTFRDFVTVSIRGQATTNNYFDEVVLPQAIPGTQFSVGGSGLFYDLESIQALKGPQGTLFGRNTTGGVLLFSTRKPQDEIGGYLDVGYGNYNNREATAVINVPFAEGKLLTRLAVNLQRRDGFTHILATPQHPNGVDADNRHTNALRASVSFIPNDNIRNDFSFSYYDTRARVTTNLLSDVNPAGVSARLFPGLNQALIDQRRLGVRTQIPLDIDPRTSGRLHSYTDTLTINLSDTITFRNIFNHIRFTSSIFADYDGTRFPIFNRFARIIDPYTVSQISEEAQLQGEAFGGRLDWLAGGFYLRQKSPMSLNAADVLGNSVATRAGASLTSYAVFGQGTYDLSSLVDGLKFTAGVRYTWDRPESETQAVNGQAVCTGTCAILNRKGLFRRATWNLALDYQVAANTMIYATARTGFKSGGFNAVFPNPALANFGPEVVTDKEIGIKSDWSIGGVPIRTNLALFHQAFSSIQTSQNVTGAPGQVPSYAIINNAATARIKGAEFEAQIVLTPQFELGGQFSWLDFKYTSFLPGVDPVPLRDAELFNRPRYTYALNARYQLLDGDDTGALSVAANWAWQSRYRISTPTPPPNLASSFQSSYGLLNLNLDWRRVIGSNIDASIYITNVTNKIYTVGSIQLMPQLGLVGLGYGEPRMYGLRLKYSFGGEAL
jgi:iron complex outermembrane recepter protein